MRLAGFLLLLLALPVVAQPAPPQASQHGISVSRQSFSLFDTPATPSLDFDAWVEGLGSDYAESVIAGNTRIDRGPGKTTIERYVRDNLRQVYARYSVTVEEQPGAGTYRMTFQDSSEPVPTDLRPKGEWKVVSPAKYPVPQIMREGDELPLELHLYSKGIRLVDYLRIGQPQKIIRRRESARDSYAEDAEFTLARPRMQVNGVTQESVRLPETICGGVLWLYVPDHGRYIVTFVPHPDLGLERAGEVAGNLMTLTAGRDVFRIESADRIAAGGGIYNVYGVRDANWLPADPKDRGRFMVGTSPGMETAIGR